MGSSGDRNDLLVHFPLVLHGDDADGIAPYQAPAAQALAAPVPARPAGRRRPQRCARDQTVVCRIVGRGIKDAVQNDMAGLLIQLTFSLSLFTPDHRDEIPRLMRDGLISCQMFVIFVSFLPVRAGASRLVSHFRAAEYRKSSVSRKHHTIRRAWVQAKERRTGAKHFPARQQNSVRYA